MADYEDLLKKMAVAEKELKDKISGLQKLYKSLSKSMEKGDLKSWNRDLGAMRASLKEQEIMMEAMQAQVDDFGIRAYVENGEFAEQMLLCCDRLEVDVKGEFPMYEMFPFRVRVDTENLDLYLDRKRVQCLRPLAFVQDVKASRDKLLKAAFDPKGFVKELAAAYDLMLLKQNQGKLTTVAVGDIYLKNLYTLLTPMRRFRRDYDQQSFAFDLARLYGSDLRSTEDGRQFQFGPSRNINKAIRILDQDGREQYLATIRFFEPVASEQELA
ncbi:hypothetical protein CEB3_c11170 [Peptococcaceae bacterium CEB3]|nr:hypothetical protein CEB3_c11170 [Peptococcaceae bacterium CEB3]